MISKEAFVKSLNAILEQYRIRAEVEKSGIRKLGIEFVFDDNNLEEVLVDLLDVCLDLDLPKNDGLVAWWLYDCGSFSRRNGEGSKATLNGKTYIIRTPEELYDYATDFKAYDEGSP